MARLTPGSGSWFDSGVPGTSEAREDLPALGQVPVAKAPPDDIATGRPRAPAQHPVAAIEEDLGVLAVGKGLEPRVRGELRRCPFPDVAQHLHRAAIRRGVAIRPCR